MSGLALLDARLASRDGRWDIVCDGATIAEVRPHRAGDGGTGRDGGAGRDRGAARDVRMLGGALVTAAYTDVHHHLDKAFAPAANRSGTLDEAIRLSAALKRRATEADVHARVLRGARMALAHGTTRLRTHVDVDPVAGLTGVRGALRARAELRVPHIQVVAFPQEGLGAAGAGPAVPELLRTALELGCDAVGGIPARDEDPAAHVRTVMDLAAAFDVPVDLHVDESDDPDDATLALVAQETHRRGWAGRVTASHCCSLGSQPPQRRDAVIAAVAAAGVHVVTLPSTNLHLQGRGDDTRVRRGLTPVVELLAAGVNVAYGSDNVRDPFNPFGNADMTQIGWLLAHAAHMGGAEQLAEVHAMGTTRAAAVWAGDRGPVEDPVVPAAPADLLVFDAESTADVLVGQLRPTTVVVDGRVAVERRETVQFTARS